MDSSLRVLCAAVLLAVTGCAHRQLDAGSVGDIRHLAVVVRATSGPKVDVARSGGVSAFPTLPPSESDQRLQELIAKQVAVFEIEERVRAELMKALPGSAPWSTALSAADVATALQSLLVVDRTMATDYDALRSAGADAVLELTIKEWGVANRGKTQLYLKGSGRMFHLPGKGGVWSDSLDTDLTQDPEADGVDVAALKSGGFRDALKTLVGKLTARLSEELAGKP